MVKMGLLLNCCLVMIMIGAKRCWSDELVCRDFGSESDHFLFCPNHPILWLCTSLQVLSQMLPLQYINGMCIAGYGMVQQWLARKFWSRAQRGMVHMTKENPCTTKGLTSEGLKLFYTKQCVIKALYFFKSQSRNVLQWFDIFALSSYAPLSTLSCPLRNHDKRFPAGWRQIS